MEDKIIKREKKQRERNVGPNERGENVGRKHPGRKPEENNRKEKLDSDREQKGN